MRWTRRDKERTRPQSRFHDYLRSWFFIFTLSYAIYYIIGAGVGFSYSGNYFCLGISGGIGVLLLLIGVGHAVDHFRSATIETIYFSVPFSE